MKKLLYGADFIITKNEIIYSQTEFPAKNAFRLLALKKQLFCKTRFLYSQAQYNIEKLNSLPYVKFENFLRDGW